MKSMRYCQYVVLLLMIAGTLVGCSKDAFLDKKPNTQLVVPTTLTDFQTLLDNQIVMQETPELGELSSDNYYLSYNTWQSLTAKPHNAYIWAKDIYGGQGQVPDYNLPYQQVFYANVVLDGLKDIKVDETNRQQWNMIKGSALFIRAYAFYNLSQLFAPAYDASTAGKDMGIALRLSSDVNQPSKRASVQETYDQILSDLRQADSLLPEAVPTQNLNRPSQPAALAMLARVCLSMRNYDQAGTYANSSLQLYHTLKDFYTTLTDFPPIPQINTETLYQSVLYSSSQVMLGGNFRAICMVDSSLYASYAPGDLRKVIFYKMVGQPSLPYPKWSYSGKSYCFSGLAVDEVYLIRAECAARAGNKDAALADLNTLLQHRWDTAALVSFKPIIAASASAALDSVLVERRKELAFRGLRWTDIRRLNKEGANITITHGFYGQGQVYRLPPSSPNYVLPLPPDVTTLPDFGNRVTINPN
ncbi:MAG: RagB/SusD family nutrient uptake outer membrane protein [Chitinophagaceae bacterium]|nr:RagB/SusD family nutrient uptake outer membrane protein [Chitinophagaceae bacterium]